MKETTGSRSLMVQFHDFAQLPKVDDRSVLYIKAISIFIAYVLLWTKVTFFLPDSVLGVYLCYIMLGIIIVLIGFWILHDVGHGTFLRTPKANRRLYLPIEMITGASMKIWKLQHDTHHGSPNSPNDTDIQQAPFLRMHPDQELKWYHRYQHLYAPLLYTLSFFSWIFGRDFKRVFSGRIDDGEGRPRKLKMSKRDYVEFALGKTLFFATTIVIPLLVNGWVIALPLLTMFMVMGLLLACVFQPAHVNTESKTLSEAEVRKIGYLEMQLATTMDFATGPIWTQVLGGLNLQVAHHCATYMSHVNLYTVSRKLREFAKVHGLKYQSMSLPKAWWSHLVMLYRYGRA